MGKWGRILPAGALALIAAVFAVEGGYVNDPRDPGGETNHGITKAVARQAGYTGPMRELSKEIAAEIYFEDYIEQPGFVAVLEHSLPTAEELVDSGVNAGPGRAARWMQESLNHLNNGGRDYPDIAIDGRIGAGTRSAYAALRRRRGDQLACVLLIRLLDAKQAQHYMDLADRSASFEAFMVGWVRTRVGNVPTSHCPGRPS
jgi:lysozyme family protein